VIRNHPAVCQVDWFIELDSDDLGINLDDDTFQPAAYSVAFLIFVIAIHFHTVADSVNVLSVGSGGES
jgi:hypothetical protein